MNQAYRIDRLNLITYKGQKKKIMQSLCCRYIAKSQVVNCTAQAQAFEFVNFRGSHFKNVDFRNATFYGCDFWGTSFTNCRFSNAKFHSSVFMACRFKECDFTGSEFAYSVIVNTNLSGCQNIGTTSGIELLSQYPKTIVSPELANALEAIKFNRPLKKKKLLFISETKYIELNLFLLQRQYRDGLPKLLLALNNQSTSNITTYKKLERTLHKISKSDIISMSRPTQSRGCAANET